MFKLSAKIKKETDKSARSIRKAGSIPAIVYGHKIKNSSLVIDYKEFSKTYSKAGENSLIELDVEGLKEKKLVLVHEVQRDPVTDEFIHIDFFETSAKEEVEAEIPLLFEGISSAVKDLGGTLVKNMSHLEVKAFPQDLPHEIKVDISGLVNFGDHVLVKDIVLPVNVKVSAKPEEIVVLVKEPEKVEEELAKEIEENIEDVEKVEKPKKEEEVVDEKVEEPKK